MRSWGRDRRRRGAAALPQPRAEQAANLPRLVNRPLRPRRERPASRRFDQRQPQTMRIGKREDAPSEARVGLGDRRAVLLQALGPEAKASLRHFEAHLHREPVTGTRRRHLRPWEEREIGAGVAVGVSVEQVIRAGIVLVDAALDEPHAEDARVEVEILLRPSRDGRDVMQPVDAIRRRHDVLATTVTPIAGDAQAHRERRAEISEVTI